MRTRVRRLRGLTADTEELVRRVVRIIVLEVDGSGRALVQYMGAMTYKEEESRDKMERYKVDLNSKGKRRRLLYTYYSSQMSEGTSRGRDNFCFRWRDFLLALLEIPLRF